MSRAGISRRRGRRVRAALLGLGLLGGLLGGAQARTVKIISADTLELRQVDGQELVIITGEAVELRVDDDVVRARRVEFNRTRRVLTLVGAASYRSAGDGQDLAQPWKQVHWKVRWQRTRLVGCLHPNARLRHPCLQHRPHSGRASSHLGAGI